MLEFDCGGCVVWKMPGKIHTTSVEIRSSTADTSPMMVSGALTPDAILSIHQKYIRCPLIPPSV